MGRKKETDELAYLELYIDIVEGSTDRKLIKKTFLKLLHSTFEVSTQQKGSAEDYLWGKTSKLARQIEQLENE